MQDDNKFRNRYRIDSTRLHKYDYGQNGDYFITICTKNRHPYLGQIQKVDHRQQFIPTPIGGKAIECWNKIPILFPYVHLDEYSFLPDHMHGIIRIRKEHHQISKSANQFGPQSQNIASIIRGFKGAVKSFANKNNLAFDWQPRFHDRIIRDDLGLEKCRWYIKNNVANWRG